MAKFALGFGFLAQFFAAQGIHIMAVPYYQMILGVDPLLLGLALTIPLLMASTAGPLAGYLSDNFSSRWGRRRPFIVGGAWALCVSYGMVWMVPQSWSGIAQVAYFTLAASAFYLSGVVYSVTLRSFTYELAGGYHQRTAIMGFTAYFVKAGSLIYQWAFPLAQLAWFGGILVGVKFVGWGIGLCIFGLLGMLPALLVREKPEVAVVDRRQVPLLESLRHVLNDRNMRVLVAVILLQLGGTAGVAMMDYYLLVYHVHGGDIEAGSIWKGILSTAFALGGMLYVPVVVKLSYRVGKVTALKLILVLNAIGGIAKWFIYVPGTEWLILLDAALCSAIWTAMVVLIPSMVADVSTAAGQDQQHTQTGIYASAQGWAISLGSVLAFVGYGIILNSAGFEASLGGQQPAGVMDSLRFILSAGTVVCSFLAVVVLNYFTTPPGQASRPAV